jgi:hypothetical protein
MQVQSVEPYKFYSDRSVQLLKKALVGLENQHKQAKQEQLSSTTSLSSSDHYGTRSRAYLSDDEVSDKSVSSNDSDGIDHASEIDAQKDALDNNNSTSTSTNNNNSTNKQTKVQKSKNKNKKTTEEYQKQMGTPPAETLITEVENDLAYALTISSVLFPLSSDDDDRNSDLAHFYQSREENEKDQQHLEPLLSLYNLAHDLSSSSSSKSRQNVFVVLLQSGRFACAIYNQGKCIKHTTFSRYTVRKGQGGSQSAMDNAKGKAKSIGSQLRRAGEVQLRNDVYTTLTDWKDEIDNCSLFFLSLSKMLQKGFWEDVQKIFANSANSNNGGGQRRRNSHGFRKGSDQVKSIPLDIGKPCFESCCAVYDLLMTCSRLTVNLSVANTNDMHSEEMHPSLYAIEEDDGLERDNNSNNHQHPEIPQKEEFVGDPLTPLHQAAMDGNIEELASILSSCNGNHDDIDSTAGPKLMTPLHFAADSSSSNKKVDPSTAAKCVLLLLTQGHANPCMLDSHDRPPSYLASNDTVRNAFRLARSELGEEMWNWTDGAKVGPALTNDDLKSKKEKAAEKKRKQRARQKQRKALEQQKAKEEERLAKEKEEMKEKEENARRVRAGLKPKSASAKNSVLCDYCQTDCKGKRKSQLFTRLNFLYCSSDCMRKHQRELMAAAATARMMVN